VDVQIMRTRTSCDTLYKAGDVQTI
jgi:hypothetical protein